MLIHIYICIHMDVATNADTMGNVPALSVSVSPQRYRSPICSERIRELTAPDQPSTWAAIRKAVFASGTPQ